MAFEFDVETGGGSRTTSDGMGGRRPAAMCLHVTVVVVHDASDAAVPWRRCCFEVRLDTHGCPSSLFHQPPPRCNRDGSAARLVELPAWHVPLFNNARRTRA